MNSDPRPDTRYTVTSVAEDGYYANSHPQNVEEAERPFPTAAQQEHAVVPLQLQVQEKKRHRPYFLGATTFVQLALLIVSLVYNSRFYGALIETQPFNYMIGPNPMTLIYIGARFVPCMKSPTSITGKPIQCPSPMQSGNSAVAQPFCTVNEICNVPAGQEPNQWWRFLVPMYLHVGLVHILLNLSFQVTYGFSMERELGWWRIAFVYVASGTFGFVFGANFALETAPSVGASGALFGLIGCSIVVLLRNWRALESPGREMVNLTLVIVLSLAVGILPGIDNFSHVGGLVMGVLTGAIVVPAYRDDDDYGTKPRTRAVVQHGIVALVALGLMITAFTALLLQFYSNNNQNSNAWCPWCKYLSCVPIMEGFCDGKWNPNQV